MQILLACAKDMMSTNKRAFPKMTTPVFQQYADHNARQLMQYSVEELQLMLKCNAKIAATNKLRYNSFFDSEEKLQAVLSYTGIAYKYLRAVDFDEAGMEYAQQHLWLTSFLYGLLRPLDGIRNYRLEGSVWLPENDGHNMFDFWKPLLTDVLIDSVKADDGVLVNLASEEMKSLFDWKRVKQNIRVIQPEFQVRKDDKLKTVVVYTKMCRGAMTRYIITQRLKCSEDLKDFSFEGFEYRQENQNNRNEDAPLFVLE